jgi:hypothetical protein
VYPPSSFSQESAKTPAKLAEFALRERFQQKFPHSWDFIAKETPDAPWKTIRKYRLTAQKLWYKYTDPDQVLGVRFGSLTNYALYDLDNLSSYHPLLDEKSLQKLKWQLEDWGIFDLFEVQSSASQGIHLYFYLAKPVSSFKLACLMTKAAYDAGLIVENGQLEVFPNTKAWGSLYQGHRLPLQQDSYLLDKDYVPYSDRLESFLNAADQSAAANDVELLESRLEEAYEWYMAHKRKKRHAAPSPANQEIVEQIEYCQREIEEGFLYKIRLAVEAGFDDFHQTNDLLLTIGKLGRLAYGLAGEKLIEYIRETAVSCKGYIEYCRHKHEIHRRCKEVARWAEKQWSPFGTYPQNRITYRQIKESMTDRTNRNDERKHNAQNRIIEAIAYLKKKYGELPRQVGATIKLLQTTTKELFGSSVSDVTLKKPDNLPLWHPKHRPETQEDAEPVVVEQQIPTPPLSDQESIPETPLAPTSEPANEPRIAQDALHQEQPSSLQSSDSCTPCFVIRQNDEKPESPQRIFHQAFEDLGYTLPYMKGVMLDFSQSLYRYAGGVQIATVWKQEAKIEFESIQPNEIVQILELKDVYKHQTNILQKAFYAMVKPQNADWESGIQIKLSDLKIFNVS